MAQKYDPKNAGHRWLADLIDRRRPNLSHKELTELRDELVGEQRMDVILKILKIKPPR